MSDRESVCTLTGGDDDIPRNGGDFFDNHVSGNIIDNSFRNKCLALLMERGPDTKSKLISLRNGILDFLIVTPICMLLWGIGYAIKKNVY